MKLHTRDHDHGITTIDAGYIQPGAVAIYLMMEKGQAAFIETGTTHSLAHVMSVLRQKGLAPNDVAYVIPTHVHLDHAGGASAMMYAFPRARLVVHPRGARHMQDPTQLLAGTTAVYGPETTQRLYGEILPIPAERMILADDGHEIDLNGRILRFMDTPGHARHHFCVFDRTHAGVFTGDTLGISYRVFDTASGPFLYPTTPPTQFEPELLHASIERVMATRPRTLFLTHFGPVSPSPAMINGLHRQIDRYVELALAVPTVADAAQELESALRGYFAELLKEHGVALPATDIKRYLDLDTRLNAQGIAMWLQRQARSAAPAS